MSLMQFTISGPHKVYCYPGRRGRVIDSDYVKKFIEHNQAVAAKRGCYIFAIRSGGGRKTSRARPPPHFRTAHRFQKTAKEPDKKIGSNWVLTAHTFFQFPWK